MPPAALVSIPEAVAAIKIFPCVLEKDFPRYSDNIWKDISKVLEGRWTPNHVYHNVKLDRRKIVTIARGELGLQSINEEAESSEIIEDSKVSSEDDDENSTWFDLVLSREEWDAIKPIGMNIIYQLI